jgi:putative salt-induced outer membrane protein YdiY
VVKSDGLLIRGKTQGVVSNSRLSLGARDEYSLSERTLVYARNEYLKDRFKNIDYLLAPTGGFGLKLVNTDQTKLGIDGGAGGVWEKNLGVPVTSSGAVTAGEKFVDAFTPTASLTQSVTALWKTNDFNDALYTASVSISASMSARTQLKVEVLETYKNKPPVVTVKKSDIAVLMAIVFKM